MVIGRMSLPLMLSASPEPCCRGSSLGKVPGTFNFAFCCQDRCQAFSSCSCGPDVRSPNPTSLRALELHVQSGEEEEVGIWACHSGYARKETFLGVAVGARRRKNLSPSCWNLQLVRCAYEIVVPCVQQPVPRESGIIWPAAPSEGA